MIPVNQAAVYSPKEIRKSKLAKGDCLQAAMASLFEIPLNKAPVTTGLTGSQQFMACRAFAQDRGLELVHFHKNKDVSVERHFEGYYIAMGKTERGTRHAVILLDGELAHDPHPSKSGLLYCDTTWVFVPINPARFAQPYTENKQ